MKPLFLFIISVFLLTATTGCFDFYEEITYHRNGSGTYLFKVDMSELKDMVDLLSEMGDDSTKAENGNSMANSFGELEHAFDDLAGKARHIEGISGFRAINDTSKYIFGFSVDFKNLTALDLFLHEYSKEIPSYVKTFEGKRRKLIRNKEGTIAAAMANALASDEFKDQKEVLALFEDVKVHTVFNFDRKVKSVSNPAAVISANRKQVVLDYYLFAPEKNKGNEGMGVTVKLKCF